MEVKDKKSRIIEISVPRDIDEKWVKGVLENAIIDRLVKELHQFLLHAFLRTS